MKDIILEEEVTKYLIEQGFGVEHYVKILNAGAGHEQALMVLGWDRNRFQDLRAGNYAAAREAGFTHGQGMESLSQTSYYYTAVAVHGLPHDVAMQVRCSGFFELLEHGYATSEALEAQKVARRYHKLRTKTWRRRGYSHQEALRIAKDWVGA